MPRTCKCNESACDCGKEHFTAKRAKLRDLNTEIIMKLAEWSALKEQEAKARLATASVLKELRQLELLRYMITYNK